MIPELQGQFRGIAADNERVDNSINAADTSALLEGNSVNIQHVAGVIDHDDINRLKRLIFRSTKGKSYLFMRNYVDADEQDGHQKGNRSVYIIVFWDGNHIREKIQKICDSFSGNRYELPVLSTIPSKIAEIETSISNARSIYHQTRDLLRQLLINFDKISENNEDGKASTIYIYKMFLAKEKALYQNLNMMKRQNNILIGFFWAPLEYENVIRLSLQSQTATKMVLYNDHNIPEPTFFKKNEFSTPW